MSPHDSPHPAKAGEFEGIDGRIVRILGKLERVRRLDPDSFGKSKHQFKLNAPLNEAKLLHFEAGHQIRLPSEFRRFVVTAGDGGAGPAYGLLPFSEWGKYFACSGERISSDGCILSPEMRLPTESGLSYPEILDGTITIVNEGCSYSVVLIVTGPFRGRIVRVDEESDEPPYFAPDTDFLSWYEQWLDHLLWGWVGTNAGDGLPGNEEEMVRVLRAEESTNDMRRDALRTLARIPTLSAESAHEVLLQLNDSDERVRYGSLHLVGKHRMARADAKVRAFLHDTSPQIRHAAVDALSKLQGPQWQDAMRPLLGDSDGFVWFNALCALKDAKALHKSDLDALIASPDAERRKYGIWAWQKCGFSVTSAHWFTSCLQDPDINVRRQLILSCADANDREILPHLTSLVAGAGGEFDELESNVRKRLSRLPRKISEPFHDIRILAKFIVHKWRGDQGKGDS